MTTSNINKMIDYCIKFPEKEEYEIGHKYPYYSCDLLCSVNGLNIDKLLDTHDKEIKNNNNINIINKDIVKSQEENEEEEIKTEDKDENQKEIKSEEKIEENIEDSEKKEEEIDNIKEQDIINKSEDNSDNKIIEKEKDEKEINESEEIKKDQEKENENLKNNNIQDMETGNVIGEKEEADNIKENKEMKQNEIQEEKDDVKMEIEEQEQEQEQESIEYKPNISLVHSIFNHIFKFLDDKEALENDVLSGYFNKIVNYLIKTKTRIILEYILLHRENLISKLIQNINLLSISNIISNILNALTEENTPEANEKYMFIVNESIDFIASRENNSETDINYVELICDLIINHIIYNNKLKFSKIIDANIITKFEKILIKFLEKYEMNYNKILHIINLLTKMNKSILSNFDKKITSTKNSDDTKNEMINLINAVDKFSNQFISFKSIKNDFKDLLYNSFINSYIIYCNSMNNICIPLINNLIKKNKNNIDNNKILTSYSEKEIEKFGYGEIIEFEFITSLIDIYINLYNAFIEDENKSNFIKEKLNTIANTNFFKFIIEKYFKYKHNNFVSNIMLDLIQIIFDNNISPEEIIQNILLINNKSEDNKDDNLINLLINDIINNTKMTFENSENKANSFIFSTNVSILKYIFSCSNPCMTKIIILMDKEKFFYKYFITNIYSLFYKKLYKTDTDSTIDRINALGIRFGLASLTSQSNTNIAFSLESFNQIINFYLNLYDKYLKGEEYEYLFDERKKKLEEIKKSSEYLKLNNQKDDELEEEEEEVEDNYNEDIPKPFFFNSKLEKKINENEDNSTDTDKSEDNEDKNFNEVNYWHIDTKNEDMEELLKDL